MTSIFDGQPLKTRPFRTKRRVIWVPGIYLLIYYIHVYGFVENLNAKLMENKEISNQCMN